MAEPREAMGATERILQGKGITLNAIHAVTFLASMNIRAQGKITYARSLATLLNLAARKRIR